MTGTLIVGILAAAITLILLLLLSVAGIFLPARKK